MPTNLAQFIDQVQKETKNFTHDEIVLFQKKVVFEALTRITMRTPVDTGRARGNWQVTINATTEEILEEFDKDGRFTIQDGMGKLANLQPFSVVHISNNVAYIIPLEEGHSDRGGMMVELTIEELKEMFT